MFCPSVQLRGRVFQGKVISVYTLKNSRDTSNFDREFTKMPTELTPTDKLFIMNLDQDEFLGFSYTNPEYVQPNQG
ncbi:hypothetical protein NFI96_005665 [Prochilodus magdalenae]|nr:hypothetical protein NFI96_005665 [Prochilodus magdalenae]